PRALSGRPAASGRVAEQLQKIKLPLIPNKTVQEILEAARIEEVVQDFVQLKRRGTNMIGLCPFHHEKTPSFIVSPGKNLFKCFGCSKGGNPARFIMEHENLSFPDALRYLARKYRIEIAEVQPSPEMLALQQEEESLYIVNDFARQYYQEQLFDTDIGKSIGLSYFKDRGFREETIRKFGLGFAPRDGAAFTRTALGKGYKAEYLQKLGLTTKSDRDFFRNRVMFTIFNLSGKTVAFAGRIMEKDANAPKYINSPETDIYTKSRVLYGANFAQKAIRQLDQCILVEGYTDVISLHQAGIENVVASSGTSLTEGQIALVKRLTRNILILYDGDPAGIKAALRGLDMILEQDMNVRVALIPDREDPDSYLQKVGAAAFQDFIKAESRDFILFKTNLLLSEVKGDPVRKAGLVRDIVESIAKVPDPFKRSFFIKECARITELDEEVLVTETNKAVRQILQQRQAAGNKQDRFQVDIQSEGEEVGTTPAPIAPPAAPAAGHAYQEQDIIRILVAAGGKTYDDKEQVSIAEFILGNIEEILDDFDNELYQRVARETLDLLVKKQAVSPDYFIGHPDTVISSLAVDLLQSPWEYSPGWEARDFRLSTQKMPEDNFDRDSVQSLLHFKLRKVVRMYEKNQQKLKEVGSGDDGNDLQLLLQVQLRLLEMRNALARELGIVVLK
ncbi:MAG: hypothetical protein RI973_2180, partial [Bacteroidota bacterium]